MHIVIICCTLIFNSFLIIKSLKITKATPGKNLVLRIEEKEYIMGN